MTREPDPPPPTSGQAFDALVMVPGADLVAVGGPLAPDLVLEAYRRGIFPWYDAADPVLWWSPDPRAILPLESLHVPRRLLRTMRTRDLEVRVDTAFEEVMAACDENRPDGSWIHAAMRHCYADLHARGHAHSLEVRSGGVLVGGIYGVAVGGAFAAESMFHRVRDASKVALVHLAWRLRERGFTLLDVQFRTRHLGRFGVVEIPRDDYLRRLDAALALDVRF
jgi:leucyl/phenylalanyl-tRNA--protein transferase